jgi:hypothetical protein
MGKFGGCEFVFQSYNLFTKLLVLNQTSLVLLLVAMLSLEVLYGFKLFISKLIILNLVKESLTAEQLWF